MTLAVLQKFAPLLSLSGKKAGDLSDDELIGAAKALAGDGAQALLPLLQKLRGLAPGQAALEILGSEQAQGLFTKLSEDTKKVENSAFIKCPHCERLFETDLQHRAAGSRDR